MTTTSDIKTAAEPTAANNATGTGGPYARYVLVVLTTVYVLNFIDRQILSILAEDIKADLGISDAQIGFLYGTAFAVFYALFGIPLGRLADLWVRTRLITIGLCIWSLMTALSGTARNFTTLAAFRLGVGVGEASANPASYSLLADYYSPRMRTVVMSIFSSGGYIGLGLGVFLGGTILDSWNAAFPDPTTAPFGLKGWQAAFFAVGLPGLLMAVLVAFLREPPRGQSEGLAPPPPHPAPFSEMARELIAIIPPLTLVGVHQAGCGWRGMALNLAVAACVALAAYGLALTVGVPMQWAALGVGVYGAFSWAQTLARRDPPTFRLIFRSRTFALSAIGFPCMAFVAYGLSFWTAPFLIRVHGVSAGEVGMFIGASLAVGGWAGVTIGGFLADWIAPRIKASRHAVGLLSATLSPPFALLMLTTSSLQLAYVYYCAFVFFSSLWFGPAYASVIDLVLPRMRAIATALMIFMATLVGLALGPFTIGRLSDAFVAGGAPAADGLRYGMMSALMMFAVAFVLLWIARQTIEAETASKFERARAAGEDLP